VPCQKYEILSIHNHVCCCILQLLGPTQQDSRIIRSSNTFVHWSPRFFISVSLLSGAGISQSVHWLYYVLDGRGSILGVGIMGFLVFATVHQAYYLTGILGSFPGGKATGMWSWSLTLPSAEVKNAWRYNSILQYVFTAWCLINHRISFHSVVLSTAHGQLYLTLRHC
jgi:hypothetical protein